MKISIQYLKALVVFVKIKNFKLNYSIQTHSLHKKHNLTSATRKQANVNGVIAPKTIDT